MNKHMVMIAQIIGTHSIKGDVRLKSYFVDQEDLEDYQIYDENSQKIEFKVKAIGRKDSIIISINNVNNIDEARKFVNKRLFVKREDLPELEEDEYYYHDIIGVNVYKDEKIFGKVRNMYNHGGGELLEIQKLDGKIEIFSFNDENFPKLDLKMQIIYMS